MACDDEMMIATLLKEEATITVDMIVTCILGLLAQMNATLQYGGSNKGMTKNQDRHRMDGHLILDANYFGLMVLVALQDEEGGVYANCAWRTSCARKSAQEWLVSRLFSATLRCLADRFSTESQDD